MPGPICGDEMSAVLRLGVACALAAFALDQGSKAIVLASPALAAGVKVLPFFNLVCGQNSGVTFGMFGGAPWWVLALLALAIVAALSVWLWRAQNRLVAVALGLLIGGALGNVLDRPRHGAVTDFLDFRLGAYHWPPFNLADVAVVSGVALLLLDGFRAPQEQRHGDPEEG
jgi:signal peptidase II